MALKKTINRKQRPARRFEVFRNDSTVTDINMWNFRRMYNSEVLYTGRGYDSKSIAKRMAAVRTNELKIHLPVIDLD